MSPYNLSIVCNHYLGIQELNFVSLIFVFNVLFISKKDGSTQEWIDKIERVTKHQVASEKIQSKSGKDFYFQYYLDGKTKTVSRQNYKKKGDFFDIYGPPMKTYCEEVSANWDKSEDEIKPEDKDNSWGIITK